jgi:hypothetical protein
MQVDRLKESEAEAWDSFLRGSPGGLFAHSIAYRDLLAGELGCDAEYLVARESGEIRGVLPAMWTGGTGARILNSLPYYGSPGGPVASDPRAARALIDAWNERASDAGTLAATMVENPFAPADGPEPKHELTDRRISQYTVLAGREGDLTDLISSEARNNVRRAERRGVSVRLENDAMADVVRIHRETMAALGAPPKSEPFFRAIQARLRPGQDFDIWIARVDSRVVAALLVVRFNGVSEYFASGTRPRYRWHNPHAALVFAALHREAQRGARVWNWGGTRYGMDGVFHFKRKWGSRQGFYRYFVKVNDRSLLDGTPGELMARFPNFYIVPFDALGSRHDPRPRTGLGTEIRRRPAMSPARVPPTFTGMDS